MNRFTADDLRPFRVITIESADCLPAKSAAALAAWVREGGTLIAAPDTASYDELGRKLPHSLLWQALEFGTAPTQQRSVGKGKAIAPNAKEFATTATRLSQPFAFLATPDSGAEVVAYRTTTSLVLHIIRHEKANHLVTLSLHKTFAPDVRAQLYLAGVERSVPIPISKNPEGDSLTIPSLPLPIYCVVEIPLQ